MPVRPDDELRIVWSIDAEAPPPAWRGFLAQFQNALILLIMIATMIVVDGIREIGALLDVLILGVSLAVAAVPGGLPAVATAVLLLDVMRITKRNAIVRRMPDVETLGSANVVASHKTGTMTKNDMTGRVDVSGTGCNPTGELHQGDGVLRDEVLRAEVLETLRATAPNPSGAPRGRRLCRRTSAGALTGGVRACHHPRVSSGGMRRERVAGLRVSRQPVPRIRLETSCASWNGLPTSW